MLDRLLLRIPVKAWRWLLLAALAFLTLAGIYIGIKFKNNLFFGLPFVVVITLAIIYDYKQIFYLMIFCIPWSMQVELPGGNAMDFFSEPFMLVFLAIFIIQLLAGNQFKWKGKIYPFHLLVFLLLFWTVITTITSHYPDRSVKFLLAKLWYVAPFVYIADKIFTKPKDVKRFFWTFLLPLLVVIVIITIKHASENFSFEASHNVPYPLFANAVGYSATLALILPWAVLARKWYSPKTLEWYFLNIAIFLILTGVLFAFKRGGWLITAALPVIYVLIRVKVFDKFVYAAIIVAIVGIGYLLYNNNYYYFAPNYASTIWHEGDLSGHLNATLDGTEISAAERFYRWVAAKNMVTDMPFTGSGPSTFNQLYKEYADGAFRTYVSDNPEQSTTHNYFLMTFAEQGFPGGFLFIGLCLFMLLKAYHFYHKIEDPEKKNILMMALLSYITILFHSLLNEFIEIDKVGPMFWLCLVLIHKSEVWHEQSLQTKG